MRASRRVGTLKFVVLAGPWLSLACVGHLDGYAPPVDEAPGAAGGTGTTEPASRGAGSNNADAAVTPASTDAASNARSDVGAAAPTGDAAINAAAPRKIVPCLVAGALVEPGPLTAGFTSSCAGCHGPAGQGLGVVPAVPGKRTFADFLNIVRKGQKETMPAFPESHVSDDDLFRDYVKLTGTPAKVPAALRCTNGQPIADDALVVAIREGLAAWRKPDKDGAACANCHGPEPFDLAYVGYDDATVIRRALPHVDQADAFKIVKYVQALRAKHNLPARDPMTFRPFQPGGLILPARSNDPADRDHAFGLSLAGAAPTLAGPRIDSAAKALKARDELLAINPRTFPIAIPLNRWTEDKFRGVEHASLNEWITEIPVLPKDTAKAAEMYALHDAYIANPTWQTLWPIDAFVSANTSTTAAVPLLHHAVARQFKVKYRGALFAQHHFREKAQGLVGIEGRSAAPHSMHNEIWEVGDTARQIVGNVHPNATPLNCSPLLCIRGYVDGKDVQFPLPQHTLDNLNPKKTLMEEYEDLQMSWFWAGWQVDITLYHSAQNGSTQSSEYFTGALYGRGYYNHLTYVRFRKNLAIAYDPGGAVEKSAQRIAHVDSNNFGYFLGYGRGYDERNIPLAGEKRDLYARLLSNAMRMQMLLIVEEIGRTGQLWERPNFANAVPSTFEAFLKKFGGAAEADAALAAQTRTAIASACDLSPRYRSSPNYCGPK